MGDGIERMLACCSFIACLPTVRITFFLADGGVSRYLRSLGSDWREGGGAPPATPAVEDDALGVVPFVSEVVAAEPPTVCGCCAGWWRCTCCCCGEDCVDDDVVDADRIDDGVGGDEEVGTGAPIRAAGWTRLTSNATCGRAFTHDRTTNVATRRTDRQMGESRYSRDNPFQSQLATDGKVARQSQEIHPKSFFFLSLRPSAVDLRQSTKIANRELSSSYRATGKSSHFVFLMSLAFSQPKFQKNNQIKS